MAQLEEAQKMAKLKAAEKERKLFLRHALERRKNVSKVSVSKTNLQLLQIPKKQKNGTKVCIKKEKYTYAHFL